jgi:hypothetical protein
MNLSPSWIDRLVRHGFEAVHWSTIGAATAPDVEILRSSPPAARRRLAFSRSELRTCFSDAHRRSRSRSAPGRHRAWRADFNRRGSDARENAASPLIEQVCRDPRRLDGHRTVSLPWLPVVWRLQRGTGWGNQNSGAPFPRADTRTVRGVQGSHGRLHDPGRSIFLPVCGFPSAAGGALCRRPAVGATVAVEQSGEWGVRATPIWLPPSSPHAQPSGVAHAPHACHDYPARRRDAGDTAECGACVERGAHVARIHCARASVRFFRKTAFI